MNTRQLLYERRVTPRLNLATKQRSPQPQPRRLQQQQQQHSQLTAAAISHINSPFREPVEKVLDEDTAFFFGAVLEALLHHVGGELVLAVRQQVFFRLESEEFVILQEMDKTTSVCPTEGSTNSRLSINK